MGNVRLQTPLVRIIRDGFDPIEIQTINADMVLWDRTRYKHKWPPIQDAPILWVTFISWAGARRTGAIPEDFTYERWEAEVLEATPVDTEPDDETGLPTIPGPVPG